MKYYEQLYADILDNLKFLKRCKLPKPTQEAEHLNSGTPSTECDVTFSQRLPAHRASQRTLPFAGEVVTLTLSSLGRPTLPYDQNQRTKPCKDAAVKLASLKNADTELL